MIFVIMLLLIGLVCLAAYVGYKYIVRRISKLADKWNEIDIPPGYKFISISESGEFYIIENKQGQQEIVYFRQGN